MPIIMKSSDNGFVDAINKTVRFPNRPRPPRDFEGIGLAAISVGPLGGWSVSSWPGEGDVDRLTNAPRDNLESPAMFDPGGGAEAGNVTYFPGLKCYRAEVLATCEAASDISCHAKRQRRRFAG